MPSLSLAMKGLRVWGMFDSMVSVLCFWQWKEKAGQKNGLKPCWQTGSLGHRLMGSECALCRQMTGKGGFNCGCQDSETDRETIALLCHLRWGTITEQKCKTRWREVIGAVITECFFPLLVRVGWSWEGFTLSENKKISHNFMQMCQDWWDMREEKDNAWKGYRYGNATSLLESLLWAQPPCLYLQLFMSHLYLEQRWDLTMYSRTWPTSI